MKRDGIPKANLNKQIKELESKKTSEVIDDITKLIELFDAGSTSEMEKIVKANSKLKTYELRNKNGSFGKAKLKCIKKANDNAIMPETYVEEYNALLSYQAKLTEKEEADKAIKEAQKSWMI